MSSKFTKIILLAALAIASIAALMFLVPYTLSSFDQLQDMFMGLNPILILIITIVIFIIMVISIFSLFAQMKNVTTDLLHIKRYSTINKERAYLEDKIAELQDRMITSQKQWEETNHLIISSQKAQNENTTTTNFLSNLGIDYADVKVEKNFVFVLTPFNDSENQIYADIVQICKDSGLTAIRGDEHFIDSSVGIFKHIVTSIMKANIVIANINGRNANVFYELGIAHTLNKPTIIISKSLEDTPFDLATNRIILFSDSNDLSEKLKSALISIVISKK